MKLGSTIGPRAICAVSTVDDSGTHVTPFICMVFDVVVDGVGDGGLETFCVFVVVTLIVATLAEEVVLWVLVEELILWALSLAHAARCAMRASSRLCPANFPLGEMQNSAMWPGRWQCEHIVGSQSRRFVWEISALGPSPWAAQCFMRSRSR